MVETSGDEDNERPDIHSTRSTPEARELSFAIVSFPRHSVHVVATQGSWKCLAISARLHRPPQDLLRSLQDPGNVLTQTCQWPSWLLL